MIAALIKLGVGGDIQELHPSNTLAEDIRDKRYSWRSIWRKVTLYNRLHNEDMILDMVSRLSHFSPIMKQVQDEDGFTALSHLVLALHSSVTGASSGGAVLTRLTERCAGQSYKSKRGWTALHMFMLNFQRLLVLDEDALVRVLTTLSEFGVDVNDPDVEGKTAMHYLMHELTPENKDTVVTLVAKLIELGANPNQQDSEGRTALHNLAERIWGDGHFIAAVVTKLAECGADMNIKDNQGQTALHWLTLGLTCDDWEVIGVAECGDKTLTLVTEFVRLGADVNVQDDDGRTGLHHLMLSLCSDFPDRIVAVLAKLVELGANTNLQDKGGQTALHVLVKNRNKADRQKLDCISILLHCGADSMTLKDNEGKISVEYLGDLYTFDPSVAFVLLQHMANANFLRTE